MAPDSLLLRTDVPPLKPDELLARYRDYLVREKGLAYSTVAGYLTVARQFLKALGRRAGEDLTRLRPKFVTEFVVDAAEHRLTKPPPADAGSGLIPLHVG